jgi:hypothetical protein
VKKRMTKKERIRKNYKERKSATKSDNQRKRMKKLKR